MKTIIQAVINTKDGAEKTSAAAHLVTMLARKNMID
jgi:hypothetical protein